MSNILPRYRFVVLGLVTIVATAEPASAGDASIGQSDRSAMALMGWSGAEARLLALNDVETAASEWAPGDASSQGCAYNANNGHCYLLTSTETGWLDAEAEAEALGGNLATIRSEDESQWLVSRFGGNTTYWIGLTDVEVEGDYRWVSGEPLTYTNWATGEPNNDPTCGPDGNIDQDYIVTNWGDAGEWDDQWEPGGCHGPSPHRGIVELPTPEPSTLPLLAVGALALRCRHRRAEVPHSSYSVLSKRTRKRGNGAT